jgi:hypothetical protein
MNFFAIRTALPFAPPWIGAVSNRNWIAESDTGYRIACGACSGERPGHDWEGAQDQELLMFIISQIIFAPA